MTLGMILERAGETSLKDIVDDYIKKVEIRKPNRDVIMIEMTRSLVQTSIYSEERETFFDAYEQAESDGLTKETLRQNIKEGAELIRFLKKDTPNFIYAWFSGLTNITPEGIDDHIKKNKHPELLYRSIGFTHDKNDRTDEVHWVAAHKKIILLSMFLLCAEDEWKEAAMDDHMRYYHDSLRLTLGDDFFKKGPAKAKVKHLEFELGI